LQYNQPYGVSDPNASYVNGNPAIGVEGSIPPASSIEYDQREIVEVINWAWQNGLPGCNAPTNADLTQLRKAIQGFLQARYIDTHITKTVHGAGADFANLQSALEWLGQYIITPNGQVTFLVTNSKTAPGQVNSWVYTQTIEINHANSNRVIISGYPLMAASPDPANISVTGYHLPGDGTNQINYLRGIYATELSFSGGVTGFMVFRDGCTLRNLLITGSQTVGPNPYDGNGIFARGEIRLDGISIWGFGGNGMAAVEGSIVCSSSLSVCSLFNGYGGVYLENAYAFFTPTDHTSFCSNSQAGVLLWGGALMGVGHLDVRGNNNIGCTISNGSELVSLAGGVIHLNNGMGINLRGSATCSCPYHTITNNAGWGAISDGGTLYIDHSSFAGNASGDLISIGYGFMNAVASTGTNTGGTPFLGNPANTFSVANAGGYIQF